MFLNLPRLAAGLLRPPPDTLRLLLFVHAKLDLRMGVRMKTPPARLESGRVEPERRHAMARVVGPSTAPGTPIKSPCSCLLRSFSTQHGTSPESMSTIRAWCRSAGRLFLNLLGQTPANLSPVPAAAPSKLHRD